MLGNPRHSGHGVFEGVHIKVPGFSGPHSAANRLETVVQNIEYTKLGCLKIESSRTISIFCVTDVHNLDFDGDFTGLASEEPDDDSGIVWTE